MEPVRFTIFAQAASKANSREVAIVGPKDNRRVIYRKSDVALQFMKDARRQIPPACRLRLQGPVAVSLRLYYRNERPDLEEALVLDALQDVFTIIKLPGGGLRRELVQAGVYCNDRQVRWKWVVHGIDKLEPRVEVVVRSIAPTEDMFAGELAEPPLPF